jgi:hypothetical protein
VEAETADDPTAVERQPMNSKGVSKQWLTQEIAK